MPGLLLSEVFYTPGIDAVLDGLALPFAAGIAMPNVLHHLPNPFRYLVSGGISLRNLMPAMSHPFWRGLERVLDPCREELEMFAQVVLERR